MARTTVDFSGTSVFVSGGTSGINLGIAEGFAAAGARVAVMSRSQQKVDAAVNRLKALGAEAIGVAADVRDHDAAGAALRIAHEAFGDLDVLVSGAAGNFPATALDMSPNAFRSVVEIDLLGSYHVLRAAHPLLRKPGAAVINISAPQAFLPMAWQSHVCAAKAGFDMLTRVLAIEWGRDGVRVNGVVPGPIEGTEGMHRLAPAPQARDQVLQTVPAGRWGSPGDVADVCLFLASPLASYALASCCRWTAAGRSAERVRRWQQSPPRCPAHRPGPSDRPGRRCRRSQPRCPDVVRGAIDSADRRGDGGGITQESPWRGPSCRT